MPVVTKVACACSWEAQGARLQGPAPENEFQAGADLVWTQSCTRLPREQRLSCVAERDSWALLCQSGQGPGFGTEGFAKMQDFQS